MIEEETHAKRRVRQPGLDFLGEAKRRCGGVHVPPFAQGVQCAPSIDGAVLHVCQSVCVCVGKDLKSAR